MRDMLTVPRTITEAEADALGIPSQLYARIVQQAAGWVVANNPVWGALMQPAGAVPLMRWHPADSTTKPYSHTDDQRGYPSAAEVKKP